MTTPKMNSRDVRRAFKKHWEVVRCLHPNYEDDRPAKRMAFSCFIERLFAECKISERVLNDVTMEEEK